MHFDVLHFNLS
uniref:Uncharacterized protein n=1 Tax=Anguilla anguilla TaxID=7936 RepID=A0A0E9SWG1_ANGAN